MCIMSTDGYALQNAKMRRLGRPDAAGTGSASDAVQGMPEKKITDGRTNYTMMTPIVNVETEQGYMDRTLRIKRPTTELLDPDFHVAVADSKSINGFDSWMSDCYDSIMTYYRVNTVKEKRNAAIRIAKSAWEAAESAVTIGRFLNDISDNWHNGITNGRAAFDWQTMNWDKAVERAYIAKTLRHFVQVDMASTMDERIKHLAALFCNANILWRRCSDIYPEGN